MPLIYSNTTLCSHSLAHGRLGPVDLRINGRQGNDIVAFVKADAVSVFPRARSAEVSFLVQGAFGTLAAAQQYAALHFGQLPPQADLICTDDSDNPLWRLPDAALVSIQARSIRGLGIFLEYAFTGGAFESEDITLPDGDSDLVKAKVIDLTEADVLKAVTFDSPFASAPRFVSAVISAPAGGGAITAIPRESTRTAEGITFDFTAAIPAAGYKLLVNAVL